MQNIEPEKFYTPKEIADNKFIVNSKGKGDYNFILKLINRGVLKAMDYTFGMPRPQYQVLGKEIIAYKEKY